MIPPALFISFRIALAIRGVWCFQMNFCINFSASDKNAIKIFGIMSNPHISFGNMDILFMLILSMQEHSNFPHL